MPIPSHTVGPVCVYLFQVTLGALPFIRSDDIDVSVTILPEI